MEVLISIFVLSIGLLGVAAMIPVGRHEIVEAAKADRGAAVARAALREIKVRRMLEALQYPVDDDSQTIKSVMMWHGMNSSYRYTLIDPLFFTEHSRTEDFWKFPYRGSSLLPSVRRVGLRAYASNSAPLMGDCGMAEEVFVWHDDLLFNIPDDKAQRPQAVLDSSGNQQHEGNYSWMVMVGTDTSVMTRDRTRFDVSIPVFYKRNLRAENPSSDPHPEQNGEREAQVLQFTGMGLGGGDVRMQLAHRDDAKRLKKNEWTMLWAASSGSHYITHAAWYRVVAAAPENDTLVYRVTLAGPDWPVNTYSTGVRAVLMEGVVNVFTETIELSGDAFRAP